VQISPVRSQWEQSDQKLEKEDMHCEVTAWCAYITAGLVIISFVLRAIRECKRCS
jgi:hypothetical protein